MAISTELLRHPFVNDEVLTVPANELLQESRGFFRAATSGVYNLDIFSETDKAKRMRGAIALEATIADEQRDILEAIKFRISSLKGEK